MENDTVQITQGTNYLMSNITDGKDYNAVMVLSRVSDAPLQEKETNC
jgi:hypothetical protein